MLSSSEPYEKYKFSTLYILNHFAIKVAKTDFFLSNSLTDIWQT